MQDRIMKRETERKDVSSFVRFDKWSTSTVLKFIESIHWQCVNDILSNDEYTREEKNEKIDKWLKTFLSIYEPIYNYGLDWKKTK